MMKKKLTAAERLASFSAASASWRIFFSFSSWDSSSVMTKALTLSWSCTIKCRHDHMNDDYDKSAVMHCASACESSQQIVQHAGLQGILAQ